MSCPDALLSSGFTKMGKAENHYLKLLGCHHPDQVWDWVPRWSSDLNEREHLVKSAILEIHASIERLLKKILFEQVSELIRVDESLKDGEEAANAQEEDLRKRIGRLPFGVVLGILKPCLDNWGAAELSNIKDIQEARNWVTHRDVQSARYKGRSPFEDPECFAQLFVESFAVRSHLHHFIETRIDDARAMQKECARVYWEQSKPAEGAEPPPQAHE